MADGYAKVFRSMYTGSMYGAGIHVFAVWGWILASKDENGFVEINPTLVAHELGGTVEQIVEAVGYLCAPDPKSRSPEHEGRRLLKVSQFGYTVVNHARYRNQGGDRTEYWRRYKRAKRAQCPHTSTVDNVDNVDMSTDSTYADADADANKKEEREKKKPASRPRGRKPFVPPTAKEVNAYAAELGYNNFAELNRGEEFVAYYEQRGWKDSNGRPVKDWKAKLRSVWLSKMKKPQRGDYYWLPTEEQVDEIYAQCAEVSA